MAWPKEYFSPLNLSNYDVTLDLNYLAEMNADKLRKIEFDRFHTKVSTAITFYGMYKMCKKNIDIKTRRSQYPFFLYTLGTCMVSLHDTSTYMFFMLITITRCIKKQDHLSNKNWFDFLQKKKRTNSCKASVYKSLDF